MAEPLKNQFGPAVPQQIAAMIAGVWPQFEGDAFLATVLTGYTELDLMARARKISQGLHAYLPPRYLDAIQILLRSLGPALTGTDEFGMTPFLYLPHVFFVADYGLDDFEASMAAQYQLTQRFTAEFSIRPFLERYPQATLARLTQWATDPSPHVRRLVSEGTRPRLPWAPRLRAFQRDPSANLALLEQLKDDPVLYVRRSVANHLNDVSKDHPERVLEVAKNWLDPRTSPNQERRWVVEHGLRSLLKQGNPEALTLLGFSVAHGPEPTQLNTIPAQALIGGQVRLSCVLTNSSTSACWLRVDCRIGFVKANQTRQPKVFQVKKLELGPGEVVSLAKTISLKPMTTRTHYPGLHSVGWLINGQVYPAPGFEVVG